MKKETAIKGSKGEIVFCHEAGLPEPQFEQRSGSFVLTLWRDWLTAEVLSGLGLNDRQIKAIQMSRHAQRLTNRDYQTVTGATRPTAKRDLEDLVKKGIIEPKGSGRGSYYEFLKKGS